MEGKTAGKNKDLAYQAGNKRWSGERSGLKNCYIIGPKERAIRSMNIDGEHNSSSEKGGRHPSKKKEP